MSEAKASVMGEESKWTVRFQGKIEGPYTLGVLQGKLLDGSITEEADVRPANDEAWRPMAEIFDRLFPSWR